MLIVEASEVVVKVLTSEWFASLVIAPASAFLVERLFHSRFKTQLTTYMLAIQKQFPDWDGEEKRTKAIKFIRQNNKYAKLIPLTTLTVIVDTIIEEIRQVTLVKEEEEDVQN